jgi:hypothetical protein
MSQYLPSSFSLILRVILTGTLLYLNNVGGRTISKPSLRVVLAPERISTCVHDFIIPPLGAYHTFSVPYRNVLS